MPSVESMTIGKHVLRFEPPNVVALEFHEPLTDAEFERVVAWLEGLRATTGPLSALVDIRDLHRLPRGSRGFSRSPDAATFYRAIALVGASFGTRIAIGTMLRAARLLGGERSKFEYEFFSTAEEARVWLDRLDQRPS